MASNKREIIGKRYQFLLIFLIAIISRLPQLLVDNIVLDGDECIVGLMSKHFVEGKEVPLFFYGQSYGFSFLEVLFIGGAYLAMGVSALAVKVGLFSLWIIGIFFFFLSLKRIDKNESYWPLIITILLVCFPSWIVWSMKARGGYVTAFTLTNILVFLAFDDKKKIMNYLLMGILLILIYQSQPLWVPGVVGILLYRFYLDRKFNIILTFFISTVVTSLLFTILKRNISNFWSPRIFKGENLTLDNIISLPGNIYNNLHGNYYYSEVYQPNFDVNIIAIIFTSLIPILILFAIVKLFKNKLKNYWFIIFLLSICTTLGYNLFAENPPSRYLLPLTGFLVYAFFFFIKEIEIKNKAILFVLTTILCVFCFSSNLKVTSQPSIKERNIKKLVSNLEEEKIKYVLSTDGLLQWEIMFYSKEKITARYFSNTDRYMPYINIVNKAIGDGDEFMAIVGFLDGKNTNSSKSLIEVDNTFFIKKNVKKDTILDYGFKL